MDQPVQDAANGFVHSYLFMRRGVGLIGVALPFVLAIGYEISVGRATLRGSISSYYYTDMRNVFVGSMCAMGVFLICYRFTWQEDLLSTVAGVLAIAVAWCPTIPDNPTHNALIAGRFHYIFAAILFVLLSVFCLWLFPRLDPGMMLTPNKKRRNVIYRLCGVVILACIAVAGASETSVFSRSFVNQSHLLFWCESVAVFAFGASWLIKGQTLLKG